MCTQQPRNNNYFINKKLEKSVCIRTLLNLATVGAFLVSSDKLFQPLLISGFITFSVPWVRGQDPETGDGPKVQSDLPAIIDDIVYINNDCFNAYHVFVITRY